MTVAAQCSKLQVAKVIEHLIAAMNVCKLRRRSVHFAVLVTNSIVAGIVLELTCSAVAALITLLQAAKVMGSRSGSS